MYSQSNACMCFELYCTYWWWCLPSPLLDNIRLMDIVWRLTLNIIRTALCWIVWHSVHSQRHTYMSSSYRSNRLGLSHWDPYTMCRGGCLEMYYCNMVEWFGGMQAWSCQLTGIIVHKMTYNVLSGTLVNQPINLLMMSSFSECMSLLSAKCTSLLRLRILRLTYMCLL